MLKDLDQRRKGSDSSSPHVRLSPASEFTRRDKPINPTYVIAGLSLVVVALGFAWLQLSNSTATRPEIQTQVPMSPLVAQTPDQGSAAAQAEPVIIEAPTINRGSGQTSSQPEASETESVLTQVVNQNEVKQLVELVPSVPRNEIQKPAPTQSRLVTSALTLGKNVDLKAGLGVDGSIKNAAVVSEDQQDTLAVQEALGLIANNELAKAYDVLEAHIGNNRYAHQSRETYAKLLISAKEYQQAYNILDAGLLLTPNHPGFKKVKARILIQNGQVLDAVQILLSRAPRIADDLEYHEILASAQLATKDYAGASITYSSLVGENQREGKFWYGYAAAQELLGNTDVAKQAYTQAVKQASLSASLRRRSQDRLLALGL
jgi:MSHA biogenesis protein MshN